MIGLLRRLKHRWQRIMHYTGSKAPKLAELPARVRLEAQLVAAGFVETDEPHIFKKGHRTAYVRTTGIIGENAGHIIYEDDNNG